jgi:hypothetical protein
VWFGRIEAVGKPGHDPKRARPFTDGAPGELRLPALATWRQSTGLTRVFLIAYTSVRNRPA